MSEILHNWWPVAAVTLFTLFLVVQIPRKAIFPPMPAEGMSEPFASFVTFDDDAYEEVRKRAAMSWQVDAGTKFSGMKNRLTFEFDEPSPAPRILPMGVEFSIPYRAPDIAPASPAPLLPATFARSGAEGPAAAAVPPFDEELLALPDSLQEK